MSEESSRPWAFDALVKRLPDSPIQVLELGASSGLALPRETNRVIVSQAPSMELEAGSLAQHVRGDIEDSRVLRGAQALLNQVEPIMLLSIGGLDSLSQIEARDLIDHALWDLGLVGALIKSRRFDLGWTFASDRFGAGRIATILDHVPNRESDRWYLYAKP